MGYYLSKTNFVLFLAFGFILNFTLPIFALAASPAEVNLGTAGNFVILSKTLITTTGATAITGDIGVSPAAATFIQGFSLSADLSNQFSTSTYVNGKVYAANYAVPTPAYMSTAVSDMETAYNDAAGRTPLTEPIDTRTGTLPLGTTFTTGIYKWSTGVNITGDITLSGNSTDVFIFQIAGNLDISANKKILLTGGTLASNVFWAVAGTTTLEAGSTFEGTILAGPGVSTIAMQSLATLDGRALGQKDVSLIANTISALAPTSATLHVIKHVVNNSGGGASASAWNLSVTTSNGGSGIGNAAGVESPGTTYTLQTGKAYSVSESGGPSGYTQTSISSDCNIPSAVANTTYTCTITNDDNPAHLIVIKNVINNNAGSSAASAFLTTISGVTTATPTAAGVVSPGVDNILTSVGAYSVDEGAHVGYGKTLSAGCTGTIALGETKTCTITNDDIDPGAPSASITVVKVVVGGTKAIADFPLFVDTDLVTSGIPNTFAPGDYVVTENTNSSYTQVFSGQCDSSGHLSIIAGDSKTCVITNTYNTPPGAMGGASLVVPPLIDMVKVPSPLALPSGPGPVTYTYTVRNMGTVPMKNVTVVDDSCSRMQFVSGDKNNDSKLDVNETWTYDCFATLSQTHTNTAVATGWANGISTVDIASATVVVGVPLDPPLIHVTKIPSPLALSAGNGMVTYTEKVTNPGVVALSNVNLVDDKCSPVNYISGDTNGNQKLETNETWTYTCKSNLSKTTTNTVTATGKANNLTAKDFAIATVVVNYPTLPRTGFPPRENLTLGYYIINFFKNFYIFGIISK